MAGKLIYTNHAVNKLNEYGLKKWRVKKALANPTRIEKSTAPGCKNYVRTKNHLEVGVSAKKNEDNNWLIVSAWKRKLI